MIFLYLKLSFIDHAGKTVFFQFNRLPGVAAYLLDYYPVENAHFIDNVSLKSRASVLLSFFQSRFFFWQELS